MTTKKQSTSILEFVALVSPDSRFDSLFLSNYAVINVQNELARLNGRRRRVGARRRAIRHADLDGPGPAAGAGPHAAGRHQRHPAAEPGSRGRPGRRAAGAERPRLPIYARTSKAAWTTPPNSRTSSSRSMPQTADGSRGSATSAASSSAPRPTAQSFNLDGRPAAGIAISLLPDANAIAVAKEVKAKMEELAKSFPAGLNYVDALRHDEIRQRRDQRGLPDADRGRRSGADRHSRLPAGLAGDARARRRPFR